jgi:large subunit ribosomal protein L32
VACTARTTRCRCPGTAVEPTTGETHLRHHISPTGFYRGRKVLKTKADA